MPASISHEGYSAKPQYSLWDDFWALRGYRDATEMVNDYISRFGTAVGVGFGGHLILDDSTLSGSHDMGILVDGSGSRATLRKSAVLDTSGRSAGLEVILPDWFYAGVKDESMLLSLHPGYFQLTGGLARWLYRLARKHGGRQRGGWRFPLRHLHTRSGSVLRYSDFSLEIRKLAARALLDYHLWIEKDATEEFLCFRSTSRR